MTTKIKNQIVELSRLIFDDEEFKKVLFYISSLKLEYLELLVEEKLMILETIYELDNINEQLLTQIKSCNELTYTIKDSYLEKIK